MKKFEVFEYGFIIFISSLILIVIGLFNGIRLVFHLYPYLLLLGSFFAFMSMVISTKKRNYLIATSKFISYFILLGSFFVFFWPRDLLFSRIGIASDIKYENPTNYSLKQVDSLSQINTSNPFFGLSGSFGSYTAYINTQITEAGIYYLRVFDAKGNIELAPYRIPKKTERRIKETGFKTLQITFTQYDGVWESFFIGRVELWFKPNSKSNGKKVLAKNFKIDGWIR
mgnify:CR=1 FL=1